jgi:hypothetical protein
MKGESFLEPSISFDIKSYESLAPACSEAVTALSYLEFLRVSTLAAAVGQIVRQGRHKAEWVFALSEVVDELAVVDPEHRSGRAGRGALVRAAESAHGVALTASMQTHTHFNTSHFMQPSLGLRTKDYLTEPTWHWRTL